MNVFGRRRRRQAVAANKGTTFADKLRLIRRLGGGYYVVTGVWPLVNMASFEWVTGSKRDKWLVQTVAVLVTAIGATQLRGADGAPPDGLRQLSVTAALGLAAIELYHWQKGTISVAYALDAIGQLALAGAWLLNEPQPPRRDARPSRAEPAWASACPRRERGTARC
jgi:hypothetical protein